MKLQNIFRLVLITVILSLFIHSALFSQQVEYRVIQIPVRVGYHPVLNDGAVVAGVDSDINKVFMWDKGVITYLPDMGGDFQAPYDINNNSVIVGQVTDGAGYGHAVSWSNGTMTVLNPGTPDYFSLMAAGINSTGTIAGYGGTLDSLGWNFYPLIYDGYISIIWSLLGCTFWDINDSNYIVGCATGGGAFLYHYGNITYLSTTSFVYEIYEINNSNHVLANDHYDKVCLWKDGERIHLFNYYYTGGGINDDDIAVGCNVPQMGTYCAAKWDNGRILYLDSLIDQNLGIHLKDACDINNKGEILCMDSDRLLYLLVPCRAITIRDANNDTIPNVEFNLIKVVNNPPTFTDDTLGSFTTDSLGQLELTIVAADTFSVELNTGTKQLVVGDSLKIAKRIYIQPAVKHSGVLGTMYSITLDNAKFDSAGVMSFDTLNSKGTQDIILEHTELRYNLLVSVEWDAAESYLSSLRDGFRAMSNYLYDVSDGQVRLDTVMIYDNREHWDEADMRIHANNIEHPVAVPSGINSPDPGWTTFLPRKWFGNPDNCRNGSYQENPLVMTYSSDYRAKAHEFGHYGLGFYDEWLFVGTGDRCPSIGNYGFMDYEYEGGDEWASEMSSGFRYLDPSCQNTEQYYYNLGNSCWNYLEMCFQKEYGPDSIYVPVIKPDDPERKLPPGLDYFPGPNNNEYVAPQAMDYDVGALVQFPEQPLPPDPDIATLNVQVENATNRLAKADVTLINNYFSLKPKTIYQGQTDDGHGCIWVVGASQSNRLIQASVGQVTVLPKELKLAKALGNKVWMCGEASIGGPKGKRVNNQFWSNGDSLTIELKPVEGDYPLICGVNLGDNTLTYQLNIINPFSSSNPALELFSDLGGHSTDTFSYDGTKYTAQINDSLGNSGTFTIWAVDDLAQNFFFNTDYTITQLDTSAVSWSLMGPQGGAEVWIDTLNSGIQKAMILSSPYLVIRTGLDSVNIQAGETHSLSVYPPTTLTGNNRLIIRYADSDLDIGSGTEGKENSLQVFRWDEGTSSWEQMGGTVDTIQNEVSTAITDLGVYAAFTTESQTDVEDDQHGSAIPDEFELKQNYPNPFNPITQISFSLPKAANVKLEIYNLLGQKVVTLFDGQIQPGNHQILWDGKNSKGELVSSGIYFYRLQAGDFMNAKKMILLK